MEISQRRRNSVLRQQYQLLPEFLASSTDFRLASPHEHVNQFLEVYECVCMDVCRYVYISPIDSVCVFMRVCLCICIYLLLCFSGEPQLIGERKNQ